MTDAAQAWLALAACAAVIGVAGAQLSRYADIIAARTGWSRGWIGLILLATVTSLPELVNGVSAVTAADVPDIAVGNALGSCVLNLAALVILDFLYRKASVYRAASQGHILSAGFGAALIGFVGVSLLAAEAGVTPALGHVGAYTPILAVLYPIAARAVFQYERAQAATAVQQVAELYPGVPLKAAVARFAVAAAFVFAAGAWLPFIAADLAVAMRWQQSFVGTVFVSIVTCLPELAVTIGALRIGALDLEIANLLGSNLFNSFILAVDDLFFLPGPLLSHVSKVHAVSAFSAVAMTGLVVVGLVYRPETRVFRAVGWTNLGLFALYLLNTYVLYLHTR